MSKYTTEVRWICETEAAKVATDRIPEGFSGIDTIIELSAPAIFNFDFPIFDENYRLVLEKKILRHFYTREIGEETVGLWKLRLWDKLNVIMPYYNKLYNSELLEFNPLYDVDLERSRSGSSQGTNDGVEISNVKSIGNENKSKNDESNGSRNSVSDASNTSVESSSDSEQGNTARTGQSTDTDIGTNWSLFSDTPQGGVQLIDNQDPDVMSGNAYLTNATKNTVNDTKTNNSSDSSQDSRNRESVGNRQDDVHNVNNESVNSQNISNEVNNKSDETDSTKNTSNVISNTESYIEHIRGKQGSHTYSAMILEFRKTLLNIDEMILRDLEDLFFGLWD